MLGLEYLRNTLADWSPTRIIYAEGCGTNTHGISDMLW
jgi:hypothetical protein